MRHLRQRTVPCLNNNQSVSYDNNGNPTSLNGAILTWDENQLESYEKTENDITTSVEYDYDDDGLMSEKRVFVNDVLNEKYNYTWAYGQLINQIYTSYETDEETSYVIKYVYDSFNSVQGFILNHSETYLYLKNLQGDIVGIVDESGNVVVSYEYDAWGVPTTTYNDSANTLATIIEILPLTYRSYCYDYDTGLYYIENRYYNPEIGRFINADSTENPGLTETSSIDNLFIYWENHPTLYVDGDEHETYRANIIANYLYNRSLSNELSSFLDDFIYNQKDDDTFGRYRYGFSTTGPMGCGWVATYNALKMLGDTIEPHDIIREYEMSGVMVYGFEGTHPLAIAQFFMQRGYDVDISFDEKSYDIAAQGSVANILYYTHSSGGHYIALKRNGEEYLIYNLNSNSTDVYITEDTLKNFVSGRDASMLISISHKNSI